MFLREMHSSLIESSHTYPAIALLGPRQSGKTTLAKASFPNYEYVTLEDPETLNRVNSDPKGFLESFDQAPGIIIDEFQHYPQLLSYLQIIIDEKKRPGYFVLTGSQNFLMNQAISQTLAGRIAIFTLLPLSISEMKKNKIIKEDERVENVLFSGQYPRIYDPGTDPTTWYPSYLRTYVERDIQEIVNVTNLKLFRKFIGLCAGRIGQLLNYSSLSSDCGVSVPTVQAWLSLLETSYIIFLLQPHHKNFGKRLTKSPKLFFYDTGLACALLGIKTKDQLLTHYLKGGLFESLMISEFIKQSYNNGQWPQVYFWRDSRGNEVDCILETSQDLIPIEIKAGQTINLDFFKNLEYWNEVSKTKPQDNYIIYSGREDIDWPQGHVVSWLNADMVYNKYYK